MSDPNLPPPPEGTPPPPPIAGRVSQSGSTPPAVPPPGGPGGVGPTFVGSGGTVLASFGTRLAGLLIDTAIMIAVGITLFVMALVVGVVSDALGSVLILLSYLAVFGVYFYFGYLIGTKGASPGMALMGLKCIGEQTGEPVGGPLGLARAFMTWIVSCCFYLGYLLFFVGDKRQTVGDMVASSVVTEGHPKSSLSLELFTP